MNFLILQHIVQSTVEHFRCQNCNGSVSPVNISLSQVEKNGVLLDIVCPHCQTSGKLHATMNISQQKNHSIQNVTYEKNEKSDIHLGDKDVVILRNELKKAQKISQLLTPPDHE